MNDIKAFVTSISIKSELRNNMFNIIVCDDDPLFVSQFKEMVESMLEQYGFRAKIAAFSDAEDIGLETLIRCDIAFLDIDFEGQNYNGLDIARKLRSLGSESIIVFVTNYVEYAPEGYEVQAFRYILKNDIPKKLEDVMAQAIMYIQSFKGDIKIQANGELMSILLQDILYIESMAHTLLFHTLQKDHRAEWQYSCYSTLSKMEQELGERGFLRVHKSYLVNMVHIKKLNCNEVLLDNGTILRVGCTVYSECKKKYLRWRGQH